MRKRRILTFLVAFLLILGLTASWGAATIEREGDPDANVLEDSGTPAGSVTEPKKGGNKVVKVFAAPFKLFGKLFTQNGDGKLQRTTEKDASRFESVGVTRISDGRVAEAKVMTSGSAHERLATGRAFLLRGQINEAIAELSTAVSLDPTLAEAHNLLGIAFDKKGMPERAKTHYERAVKAEPDDAQTLNNLGFSLYRNGHYRAAIDRLKRAAKLAPTDERILNNLALALCRIGKFDEAYKSFARAGGELKGRINTAAMLERFGRDEEAIKYYEAARRIDPNNSIAQKRLSDLYRRTGRTSEPPQTQAETTSMLTVQAGPAQADQ